MMTKLSKALIFLLVLLGACPARATITRVQLVQNIALSATTLAVTTSATVAGNLIVVEFSAQHGGGSTLGISDNKGNTYTQYPSVFASNIWLNAHNSQDIVWYTIDAFGAVTTITMTNNIGSTDIAAVGEYASTNGWPANPRNVIGAVNSATSTSWTSGTSATTAQNSELLWGAAVFLSLTPGTITPGAGWGTGVQQSADAYTSYYDDKIVTSTGTYAYSGTSGNSVEFGAVMVTFKDNPAPSGSRFVRLEIPPQWFSIDHWAITDRERKRV